MDYVSIIGYLSGVYWIQPSLDVDILIRTVLVIHLMDGILCAIIAKRSGRRTTLWTLAGLVLGVWAVATLFLVVESGSTNSTNSRS